MKALGSRLCIASLGLLAGLIAAELGLKAAHYPSAQTFAKPWIIPDLDFRYRFKPGVYRDMFGSDARINSLGTRGPEPKKPVVLCLGDSATFGVYLDEGQTYPALLKAEAVNAGMAGFNSEQYRTWFERSALLELHPRLVTVYLGWNDHWRAPATERVFRRLRHWAERSNLAALLLRAQWSLWSDSPVWRPLRWFSIVPLGQFKSNLRAIIDDARLSGATVVLITPPAEGRLAKDGQGFFASHSLRELDDHPLYVEAVRQVAAEGGVGLVDFERELRVRSGEDPRRFFVDFVHPNGEGNRLLASLLAPWVACARKGNCGPPKE